MSRVKCHLDVGDAMTKLETRMLFPTSTFRQTSDLLYRFASSVGVLNRLVGAATLIATAPAD